MLFNFLLTIIEIDSPLWYASGNIITAYKTIKINSES